MEYEAPKEYFQQNSIIVFTWIEGGLFAFQKAKCYD